jgi:hypothetical protein
MKVFATSFFQVYFVAINTILLARGYVVGIFLASFTISLLWCYNVSKISVSTRKSKLIYATGAGIGAVSGFYSLQLIFKLIN